MFLTNSFTSSSCVLKSWEYIYRHKCKCDISNVMQENGQIHLTDACTPQFSGWMGGHTSTRELNQKHDAMF